MKTTRILSSETSYCEAHVYVLQNLVVWQYCSVCSWLSGGHRICPLVWGIVQLYKQCTRAPPSGGICAPSSGGIVRWCMYSVVHVWGCCIILVSVLHHGLICIYSVIRCQNIVQHYSVIMYFIIISLSWGIVQYAFQSWGYCSVCISLSSE